MLDSINPVAAIVGSQQEFRWADFAILFGSAISIVVVMLLVGWFLVAQDGLPNRHLAPTRQQPNRHPDHRNGTPSFLALRLVIAAMGGGDVRDTCTARYGLLRPSCGGEPASTPRLMAYRPNPPDPIRRGSA